MFNVNRYSILGILVRTIKLSKNIINQWHVLLYYAMMLTAWALLFGFWTYKCKNGEGFLCWTAADPVQAIVGALLFVLPLLHIYFAFAVDFYDAAFNNSPFKLSKLCIISGAKAKSELMFFGYALGFMLPVLVGGKFLLQPTNPDWRVEMVHFVIIFSLFMAMLFLIRTAAAISIYLQKHKYPSLWGLFEKTAGLGYVSIILFLLLMVFSLLTYMFLVEKLHLLPERQTSFLVMAAAMYIDNVFKLFFVAFMLLFCRAQHELLLPEDFALEAPANDDEAPANDDEAPAITQEEEKAPTVKKTPAKKTSTKAAKPKKPAAKTTKTTATKPRKKAAKSAKERTKSGQATKK